ncbi:hypothetical protein CI1B_23130 [Bradyrhizobium ivorense]|uniref:Uncharacterized protein n=1 Tax=Bradyrhizobium ivorense TaxID=2511166 RepID=A0A508T6Q0_9BRAD|nr:hypothetical protein CI1B_23130 [Bradyrhizobium ivorense]
MPGSNSPPPVSIHEAPGGRLQVLSVISRRARTERSQLRDFFAVQSAQPTELRAGVLLANLRIAPRIGVAPQRDPNAGKVGRRQTIPTELAGLTGQGTGSPHETAWCAATGLASSTDAAPVMTREPDWHFHQVEMDRMEQTSRRSTACRRSSRDLTTRASLFSVGVLVGSRQQLSSSLDVPWRHGIVLGRASTAARACQRAIAVKENRHMSPDCTHVSAPYGKV